MTAIQSEQQGLAAVPVAAKFLSVSANHLYQLINAGEVPSKRFGRSVRIPWEWLHAQASASNSSEVTR
ncbi:MAG: helix-turn-helix domain-containing protein [Planctomycetales bacterium]|nr:helix-turn-helix domain-containing protein [Planctomycetales bacterium]